MDRDKVLIVSLTRPARSQSDSPDQSGSGELRKSKKNVFDLNVTKNTVWKRKKPSSESSKSKKDTLNLESGKDCS